MELKTVGWALFWLMIGGAAGYFFLILIDLSTRFKSGTTEIRWVSFVLGWVLRLLVLGVLMLLAVRSNALYGVIFVLGFTVGNQVQVRNYQRKADALEHQNISGADSARNRNKQKEDLWT